MLIFLILKLKGLIVPGAKIHFWVIRDTFTSLVLMFILRSKVIICIPGIDLSPFMFFVSLKDLLIWNIFTKIIRGS